MVNVNKLKAKLVEKGMNVAELAKIINIDKATLYRKLGKNGNSITIKEANEISKALELSLQEVNEIFFAHYVA